MVTILIIFFWISFAVLVYCYIGYGVFVYVYTGLRNIFTPKKEKILMTDLPPVTLIVTSFNEEKILEKKIRNTLAINYPATKLHLVFITDGSTDDSIKLIQKHSLIKLLHQPIRQGKYAAIKRAMLEVETPIVVFSDANTMLNSDCIKKLVGHYTDKKTGGVAGEKKIIRNKEISAVGEAEGFYWQYESLMKKLDARLNTVTGAAGELFSIRTDLFRELSDDLILDDFVISMQICLQGYKIEYEPESFATELPSASLAEEEKRKVRISAGAYQSIGYLKECLNIFKHPLLSFQYISRKLLRWTLCPVMLVVLLVSNIFIVFGHSTTEFFRLMFYIQIIFYVFAMTGWILVRSGRRAGILTIPFYFVFMNYCLVKGFVKFVRGKESVLWEKSLRQSIG